MKKLFTLIIAATLMFVGSQLLAQTNVYLNLSGALPTGDFADGDEDEWGLITEDNEGGAGFGFNVGVKFNIATGVNGLRALISVDGIYNGLNSDLRDAFEDAIEEGEDNYKDFYLKTPKYINIPLMAGVNYTYNINNKFGLFAEAGLGPDLHIVTKYESYYENDYRKVTYTREYEPKVTLAYQFGAGIELSKRVTIGVNFYNLGSAKVKYEWKNKVKYTNGNSPVSDDDKDSLKRITPTILMLRVGFKL